MEIEIGRLVRAIRRFWWLPVISALVFGLVFAGGSRLLPESYTATSRVLMLPDEVSGTSIVGSTNMYIDHAYSTPFLETVIEELGLDMEPAELRANVSVVQQEGTAFLLVTATHSSPERAAEISGTLSQMLTSSVHEVTTTTLQARLSELEFRSNELSDQQASINARIRMITESDTEVDAEGEAELAGLREQSLEVAQEKSDVDASLRNLRASLVNSTSELSVLESARVPENPDGLPLVIVAIVGAFVGGVIGCGLILLSAVRDHSIVNAAQVDRITGAPVLREMSPKSFSKDLSMVNRFVSGLRSTEPGRQQSIRIVAPTALAILNDVTPDAGQTGSDLAPLATVQIANGVMTDEAALSSALSSAGVVLASRVGKTQESDLRATVDSLHVAGVPVIGNIVFKER